jgi:hypothetical protein
MQPGPFWKSDAAWRGAIFALGFLLSWLPLVLAAPIIPVPDELFQGLEAGHRLAFGYGLVPWEFDYGARSWALGVLAALPMALAGLLGQGPEFYLPLTWAFFSLGAAAMTLCAGLWGNHLYGRWGGLVVALVAAGWIDNLYFGGRTYSEVFAAHLLIVAVYLAEPGYRVESRNRLLAAGFAATLASLLRMQLGPVALLLWLWQWRDRRRLVLLSAGAVIGLVVDGGFDLLTGLSPFQPIWQNINFNLVLDGAAIFGTKPWTGYFTEMWLRWGWLTAPFAALALLGARRLPLLGAMVLVTLAIHIVIPHKEYRFILPAVMMASILCGVGLVETARGLAGLLQGMLRDAAGAVAAVLIGVFWLVVSAGNLSALAYDFPWREKPSAMDYIKPSMLEMLLTISHQPAVCGIGFTNINGYGVGGYTFLHRPLPLYFDNNDQNQLPAFMENAKYYNALVLLRENLEFFSALPAFAGYALDHCAKEHCLLIRPGDCARPTPQPRPALRPLWAKVAYEGDYPYAVGLVP